MEENYNGPYKRRLYEIDVRIEDLKIHMGMWGRAGGGRMAMEAIREINNLKAEKERILNGTQEKYEEIEAKIKELKELRAQCLAINFIKKTRLKKEIGNYEEQKRRIH